MSKLIGYILVIIGVVGIAAYSVPQVKNTLPLPEVGDTILIIISIVFLLIGIFFIIRLGGRGRLKGREVPIFHGKNIVGYRRH